MNAVSRADVGGINHLFDMTFLMSSPKMALMEVKILTLPHQTRQGRGNPAETVSRERAPPFENCEGWGNP